MNKILLLLLFFHLSCFFVKADLIQDEIALQLPKNVKEPQKYLKYNFESTEVLPIKLKILEKISSEEDVYEGQQIKFKVAKDVIYKDSVLISRGTEITSNVSVIITPGMNGIPASIILTDFKIAGVTTGQLSSDLEIVGQDRSLLVFPLKWALTILPPSGSLTNFIMGGHAKLKPKKVVEIYYHPEWI